MSSILILKAIFIYKVILEVYKIDNRFQLPA